jgi:hypothetical protein
VGAHLGRSTHSPLPLPFPLPCFAFAFAFTFLGFTFQKTHPPALGLRHVA